MPLLTSQRLQGVALPFSPTSFRGRIHATPAHFSIKTERDPSLFSFLLCVCGRGYMLAWRAGKGERKTNPPPSPPLRNSPILVPIREARGRRGRSRFAVKKEVGEGGGVDPPVIERGLGLRLFFLCAIGSFVFHTPPVLPRIREVLYDVVFVGVRQGGTECSTWDRGL